MADEKQESILKRLAELINKSSKQDSESQSSSQEVPENNLQRLFPSIRRSTPLPSSFQESRVKTSTAFNPRAKKKPYSRPSKPSKPVIRDVILLPDPRMNNVPRGPLREELYLRELVASAVEIPSEMNENEIRSLLEGLFADKLQSVNGHKFQFVRVVGNKIVQPKINRQWDAKMLKHIAGQGPIYIRSWESIEQDFGWVPEENEEDTENECTEVTDDEELLKPTFGSKPSKSKSASAIISVASEQAHRFSASTSQIPAPTLTSSASTSQIPAPTHRSSASTSQIPAPALTSSASTSQISASTLTSSASTSQIPTIDVDAYPTPAIAHTSAAGHETGSPTTSSVMCPTSFPLSLIEEHADICCERVARASELAYSNLMLTMEVEDNQDNPAQDVDHMAQEREEEKSELKYIIEKIKGQVSAKSSHIDVQRKFIFDDYLEGRKRPWIKAENRLSVVFIGEAAVDDGGPRREFFTEIFEHVKRRLFIQDDKDGFVPLESTVALTEGSFKVAGELMAMSLAQGGPAPNFLASWVYDYLSSGLDGVPAQIENIKDSKFKRVAEKIMAVETEKDLQEVLTEDDSMDILNEVGYRGVPQREKIKNKDKILRSVYVKVYVEPKIPMLNQMAKGLELYGVLDEITKNKEEMRKVFTFDNFEELTNASLRALWSINFSLPQKLKEDEIITYKAFADFICMVEYEGMSKYEVSLADVLKFITGCTQVPPLGFSKKIAITFVHGCESGCKCRPTASTCALELRLPIHIKSFDDMVSCGVSMLKECFGFGNV